MVAPVYRFKTDDEAIRIANDTPISIAATSATSSVSAEGIAPFGGTKESGIGREGSKYGIEEFLEAKYLCRGGIDR